MNEDSDAASSGSAGATVHPADLDPAARSRVLRAAAVQSALSATAVLIAYFLVPFSAGSSVSILIRSALGVVMVTAVVIFQLRSITNARYPIRRVIEGFSLAIPMLLCVFAGIYLLLSRSDAGAFSEQLTHVDALYTSMMTTTTVGFGDVAPVSESARIAVMVHMAASAVLLGVAARIAITAARRNLESPRN